jgi:hypothetical protein
VLDEAARVNGLALHGIFACFVERCREMGLLVAVNVARRQRDGRVKLTFIERWL